MTLADDGETTGFDLDEIGPRRGHWIDYVAGTAWALREARMPVRGFRGLLASDLPQGAGLSSSAALELASAFALSGGDEPATDRMTLARLAQRAENEYVGVQCGLMDQFASSLGAVGADAPARLQVARVPRRPDRVGRTSRSPYAIRGLHGALTDRRTTSDGHNATRRSWRSRAFIPR